MSILPRVPSVVVLTLMVCTGVSAQQSASSAQAGSGAGTAAQVIPPAPPDTRTQYPSFMANSYVGINIGSMAHHFTASHLEPGFTVESIHVPTLAARVTLFGHEFNRFLSAEVVYMRPGRWVSYDNVNGDGAGHSVWMNMGIVAAKPTLPLTSRVSVFAEGGLAVVSRHGFLASERVAMASRVRPGVAFGGGVDYHVNQNWDLTADYLGVRSSGVETQPLTRMISTGFRYSMRPLPPDRAAANSDAGVIFPRNLFEAGVSTNALGYGLNHTLSSRIPIFWGGNARVAHGASVHYERNLFHTKRIFAFNVGASASTWQSDERRERFFTLAVYPLMRFTVARTSMADLFVSYSLAGPSFISRGEIDGHPVGHGFTFQDMIGIGVFLGPRKNISAQMKILHYSNGNLLTNNAAVKVPTTFSIGYAF